MRRVMLSLLLLATTVQAAEPMCGTSPENDLRIRALHDRPRGSVRTLAGSTPDVVVRDGAFYLPNDEAITPGYRPFDLEGQSLVFTPAGTGTYTLRREALQYVEPSGLPARDFLTEGGYSLERSLGFTFPIFGRSVTKIYVTAFNGIAFDLPAEETGGQFDAIETAVHRAAVLSPLMTTARKPRFLQAPRAWIEGSASSVRITWRSEGNAPFGYDVQAELKSDGTITYSYRSVTAMRWGTPVILPGFDPATVARAPIHALDDSTGDVSSTLPVTVRQMLNVRRVEVERLRNSELFAIRILLNEPIDQTKLAAGEILGFQATIAGETAVVEIDRTAIKVASFSGSTLELNGAGAFVDGDRVEIYGIQKEPELSVLRSLRVVSYYRPLNTTADTALQGVPFTPVTPQISTDLSAVPQSSTLTAPIAETFVLGAFDPYTVWERMQKSHGLSEWDYDGVLMYQSFYTDIIFYAGAYSTAGNPQVDGVAPYSLSYGRHAGRETTLMHMNQLSYNYSAAVESASKVMLHEFGHRWLYFFSIKENGQTGRFLNPISAHPAAYVHTASAFPVRGPNESSVMGGAYFTEQPDRSYKAFVANYGYSWTDLYLMGLASPEEVQPWFYIANSSLPKAYWPDQGAIASGERRNVQLNQITEVHGPRNPSSATSQRLFRVLFVLVTEGAEPTAAEVAKLNEWRSVMERDFATATGGRGRLETAYVRAGRRRGVR
jgi:hypothetical protein